MRFLFALHQFVDAWYEFANSASKVIILRYSRKIHLFRNNARYVIRKLESCEARFL